MTDVLKGTFGGRELLAFMAFLQLIRIAGPKIWRLTSRRVDDPNCAATSNGWTPITRRDTIEVAADKTEPLREADTLTGGNLSTSAASPVSGAAMPYPLKELDPERSPKARFGAELRRWRLIRGYNGPTLGREAAVSGSLISKIEGGHRQCAPALAARLDEILQTDGTLTALLDELSAPPPGSREVDKRPANLDNREVQGRTSTGSAKRPVRIEPGLPDDGGEGPVQRRTLMMLAASTVAVNQATAGLLEALAPSAPPPRVTQEEIKQIVQAARLFSGADHQYGGSLVREAVNAQLRWAVALLRSDCPPKLRRPLFSAVGSLAAACGWMAFDSYAHDDARTMLALARSCAEEVGDWHLRAKALSHLGRQAIWIGDPDTGLTSIELALVRSDRLTATEQAMLHTGRARALAKLARLGDRTKIEETLRAVGRADDSFSRSDPAGDPPWMGYYDAAQHQGDTGHALFDLVAAGVREPRAARRLAGAVAGHTDQYARSRAISGTKLASLIMMSGDPAEGVSVAKTALRDAAGVRSRRAFTDLRELARTAIPHQAERGVTELRARIRTLVPDQ